MMMLHLRYVVAAMLALPALAACGSIRHEPTSPSVGLTKPIHPPPGENLGRVPPLVSVEGSYSMWITDSVRTTCSGPAPFFALDSAKPLGDDQPTMKNLVVCMTQGPLRGKTIRLVGHTDPRGTPDYNDALGLERAEKVKKFLVANGIGERRVVTASVGEDVASPAPKDWPKDRRVEIQLVE